MSHDAIVVLQMLCEFENQNMNENLYPKWGKLKETREQSHGYDKDRIMWTVL